MSLESGPEIEPPALLRDNYSRYNSTASRPARCPVRIHFQTNRTLHHYPSMGRVLLHEETFWTCVRPEQRSRGAPLALRVIAGSQATSPHRSAPQRPRVFRFGKAEHYEVAVIAAEGVRELRRR